MYTPAEHDELTTFVAYVDQQLAAIRASAFGLTEEQARETPCRSALSIAGILKHVTYVMRGGIDRLTGEVPDRAGPDAYAAYAGSFALTTEETTVGALAEFDEVRARYLRTLQGVDPDARAMEPPAFWFGITEARPIRVRFYLGHQLEEMARHAGHADIIREQIDGMAVPALVMTLEGATANSFFQAYVPAEGTIGGPAAGGVTG